MNENENQKVKEKIVNNEYTLFDKILYGGIGYGYFCMPTNIFKIIATVIFPPIGILIDNIGKLNTSFPYIGKENIKNIIMKIGEFIISFILTMMFYVPGLIYVLNKIKINSREGESYNKSNFTNTRSSESSESSKTSEESTEKEKEEDDDEDDEENIYNLEHKKIELAKLKESLFSE